MEWSSKKQVQKTVIIIGILLAILGFSFHFITPSASRSGYPLRLGASSHTAERLHFVLGSGEYTLQLELRLDFLSENLSAYILTPSEYERFSSGTSLNDVDKIAEFVRSPTHTYVVVLTENLDVFLVIQNNNTVDVFCGYYYSVLPDTFYLTVTIGFVGLLIALLGFGWYRKGWLRYFVAGASVNLLLFFIRIFTLESLRLPFPDMFGIPYFFDWFVEPYNDYAAFYLRWIPSLWDGVWPYSMDDYIYPPLWISTVGLFGPRPAWIPGLVLFFFNISTAIIIYKLTLRLTGDEKRSVFSMMLYLLNPLILFYGSFLWLNPSPQVFFITLSFYLALEEKENLSVVTLAVATLYKQLSIVFLPLLLITLVKIGNDEGTRTKVIEVIKSCLIYVAVLILGSLPFTIGDIETYMNRVLPGGFYLSWLTVFYPSPSLPVNFNTFFLWIRTPSVITTGIAYLLAFYILILVLSLLIYITFIRYRPTTQETGYGRTRDVVIQALFWSILILLILQLFFPRGSYKYYLMVLVPFISILFDHRNLDFADKGQFKLQMYHLIPLLISWIVFLMFRLVYFWVLLTWLLLYLHWSGRLNLKKWRK